MSATIRHLDAGGIASPGAPVHAPIVRSPCLYRKHLLEVGSLACCPPPPARALWLAAPAHSHQTEL